LPLKQVAQPPGDGWLARRDLIIDFRRLHWAQAESENNLSIY
jgi:hypothetical protein